MKRHLLIVILFLLISGNAFCQQTKPNSFLCQIGPNFKDLTQSEIITIVTNSQFENFRLLGKRDTLTFDNGFEIILLSALELKKSGIISDTSPYLEAFPPKFKLPIFHVNEKGEIAAAYPVNTDVKYSKSKR